MEDKLIGSTLKKNRIDHKMSRANISRITNIFRHTIRKIESNETSPKWETVQKLLTVFGMKLIRGYVMD
jgi:transcriptional regulator with XRE-family HTH domain